MSRIIYSLLLCMIFNFVSSQTISFVAEEVILNHPNPTIINLDDPFVPFDYNNDGTTDFTGSTYGEQLVLKGLSDGTFEEIELTWSQSPIKVVDVDMDRDEDVIYERHIRINEPNDEFRLIKPSLDINENITDIADLNNDNHFDFVTNLYVNRKKRKATTKRVVKLH
ncbi:MAG: hypothetical protein ACI9P5_002822 [Saprospiraceae bacterium]|jgi:hypothetical protein